MMPLWLLNISGFLKGLPWQVYAGLALLVAFPLTYCAGERSGRSQERVAWEAEIERIRAERDAMAVVVADQDAIIAEQSNQTIEERRKELDDVVAEIPDQELTDRQRARVCAERVRQGRRCEFLATTAPEGSS